MRPLLFTLVSILMLPGLGECVDAPSRRLLYCVDVFDFEWDPEALETRTIGFEECTIDWGEDVLLWREGSETPDKVLTYLNQGDSFYRDQTVEQGQSYQYRISARYNCPNAGKKDVTLQLFNNYVIKMTDGCNGELKRDLSLTGHYNEMKVYVKEGAKLTISEATLEKPELHSCETATLDISDATITTGRIHGRSLATGGVIKITGSQLVNSYVEFVSDLESEFSNSTIIKESDVENPVNNSVGLHIYSEANVKITNNDIQGGELTVEGTPKVEVSSNKFRSTEIRVNTSTGHPADKVQILE